MGKILAKEKEYASAEEHFRRAIEIHPDYAKAHYHLALLLIELGRLIPEHPEDAKKAPQS
ncbi:hypothetical protein ES703_82266 [subsurface metagenome]